MKNTRSSSGKPHFLARSRSEVCQKTFSVISSRNVFDRNDNILVDQTSHKHEALPELSVTSPEQVDDPHPQLRRSIVLRLPNINDDAGSSTEDEASSEDTRSVDSRRQAWKIQDIVQIATPQRTPRQDIQPRLRYTYVSLCILLKSCNP